METRAEHAEAAGLLQECFDNGQVVEHLPDPLKPASRTEGYAIQAALEGLNGTGRYGWKIAATSAAGQAHIGVDGPIAGRIFNNRVFEDGAALPLGPNRMRVAEAEFAFHMGRTLDPRDNAYTMEEVMAAVASLHPSIELPDSRYEPFETVGAPHLIADNACARFFVIGPPAEEDWRALDLAAFPVTGRIAGGEERPGKGANVLSDPRIALTWLANELSGLGIPLQSGETVSTGTCIVPIPIAPGDSFTADLGILGAVSVNIT